VNIVVISACDVVDRHIIGRIRTRWPDAAVLRPTDSPIRDPLRRRLTGSARSPVATLRRAYYRERARRLERDLKEWLPGVITRRELAPQPIPAVELNRADGISQVAMLRPDLLVLSGAPILRDDLLSVPTIGTINVHFGIAPRYRGEHTLFHALRERNYAHLGLTLHGVDQGIDTGPLLAHAYPALEPSDDETTLFARCAELGADVLVDCLEVVERTGRLVGRPQVGSGQLYLRRERRVVRHDLSEALQRDLLRRRPPHRSARVIRYNVPATAREVS
jgi:methionyl-tRNA formyltransferase